MSAAVISKILMRAQERAQGQSHSWTFHWISRVQREMNHSWFIRKIQKEKKVIVDMVETKIDVTFVILKARNSHNQWSESWKSSFKKCLLNITEDQSYTGNNFCPINPEMIVFIVSSPHFRPRPVLSKNNLGKYHHGPNPVRILSWSLSWNLRSPL